MVTLFPEIPIEAVDSETVRYSGAVGENGSLLSTVEVCEDGGGGGWKVRRNAADTPRVKLTVQQIATHITSHHSVNKQRVAVVWLIDSTAAFG